MTARRQRIEVKPGQVWRDRDRRMTWRRAMMVDRIETADSGEKYALLSDRKFFGKPTRISVKRMERQQGWLLVRDENGNEVRR